MGEISDITSLRDAIRKQEKIIANYDILTNKSAMINIASFYRHFSSQHAKMKELISSLSEGKLQYKRVPESPRRFPNTIDHLILEPGHETGSIRDALLLISRTEEESFSSLMMTYKKLLREDTKMGFEIALAMAENSRTQALSFYSNLIENAY